ncbi:transposase [Azorhizobium caulinodans ORS 571]|uniref:Transposase n=1 Tax=Azorhizobium caulinodans (strain ATCC 43989 / DSM 5975 / JCM 20966 / LMG 6465 / NBRC 14845 / NCIMB 13405 / ORS 571) TaxID=438753 RepID=A8HUC5_AZOC5|nr:IS481 family transposase [Azorhizobium caulinodans]BAF86928.1 transposase [Azorhizobium caulinodans ORS 571]BAF90416.1 transposase [Azorhizobium caulinodans ORS 571]
MNIHKHARMTFHGRVLLAQRITVEGWRTADAAGAAGISVRTAYKWLARFRAGGEAALHDASSAPGRKPRATSGETVAAIEALRRQRLSGPAIAHSLGLARSTVGAILRRIGLSRLAALDEKRPANRYQKAMPGELIHMDTKKLGRIDGIGHRITGDRTRQSNRRGTGWECLHVAIDDASRLAYTEVLPDEKKGTVCAFTARALGWFARHGVVTARLMTDNGSAYKSHDFRDLLRAAGVRHVRTRPYTPRTNGKAERFIQTSLREWAYAVPYTSSRQRTQAMPGWIDTYNLNRPHSAHNGLSPWTRLNNLLGNDI